MSEELTVIEKANLVELEETIQKNLTAFYEVGFALMQIRDNRLYREVYGTFEEYCKEKWGMERNYANKLIKASEVVENLGTVVPIPTSERVVRPLTRIKDPEEQDVLDIPYNRRQAFLLCYKTDLPTTPTGSSASPAFLITLRISSRTSTPESAKNLNSFLPGSC